MNRDETIAILGILKTAYPRFYANLTKQEAENTINLWQEMFENDETSLVSVAVKNLITSFQFPPTIADVKSEMYKLTTSNDKSDIELWNELRNALRNGYYGAEKIFPTLSKEIQLYLRNPTFLREMATMNIDEVDTVQKGIFLKQIPLIKEKEKQQKMMLPEAKKVISDLINKMDSNLLGERGTDEN